MKCSVEGCERKHDSHGYCVMHYLRLTRKGSVGPVGTIRVTRPKVCTVEGCGKKVNSRGLCGMHYARLRLTGEVGQPGSKINPFGEGGFTKDGYIIMNIDKRPRLVHRFIAEQALGKPLPEGVEIHHVNENRSDNRSENLVICPDKAYHKLLHRRQAAYDACGNPNYRKCCYCKQHDDPANMYLATSTAWHRACANSAANLRKSKRVAA